MAECFDHALTQVVRVGPQLAEQPETEPLRVAEHGQEQMSGPDFVLAVLAVL